ncbi:hypothetical protein C6T56_21125 [Burkholderia multivorans]|nr:hypothetical protein C6T56_21125 [Burkholderia multivorans]
MTVSDQMMRSMAAIMTAFARRENRSMLKRPFRFGKACADDRRCVGSGEARTFPGGKRRSDDDGGMDRRRVGCGAVVYDEGNGGERTAAQVAAIRPAGARLAIRSASRLASALGEPIYSSAAGRANIVTRRRKSAQRGFSCDAAQ